MPVRFARSGRIGVVSRRAVYGFAVASAASFLSGQGLQTAIADGDTRTISLHHLHTGEDLTVTYKRNGRYDEDALKKINWVLRDWRREEEINIDPLLLDTLWEVNREVGGKEAIRVICGYRAPQTNAMLRRRSKGVAQNSQHTVGKAIDFAIPGVPLDEIRAAGLRLQRGGVGFYPTSGSPFVHLDVGSIRHWPRMTHDQLARVFPDGRTVHIPTDGKPLSGYATALAALEKRGSRPSTLSLVAARNAGVTDKPATTFLAKLFGSKANEEEHDVEPVAAPNAGRASQTPPAPARVADDRAARPSQPAFVPLPQARPVAGFVVASAPTQPQPPQRPAQTASLLSLASLSPNEIINLRGYWQGMPDPDAAEPPARLTRRDTKVATADTTASIGPLPEAVRRGSAAPEMALAYAPPSEPQTPNRAAPMGSSLARPQNQASPPGPAAARPAAPTDTTVAIKDRPFVAEPGPSPAVPNATPSHFDDPWLRAMVVAPSVQDSMRTTLFGSTDFRNLRPMLHKPEHAVMMTFSNDPHLGTVAERFTGTAIMFMPTVTFTRIQVSELRNR